MEEQGLAQQQRGPRQKQMGNDLIAEVVKLLQQGVPPEELLKMGVPQEILEAAMSTMRSRMSMPQQPQGLAQSVSAGM